MRRKKGQERAKFTVEWFLRAFMITKGQIRRPRFLHPRNVVVEFLRLLSAPLFLFSFTPFSFIFLSPVRPFFSIFLLSFFRSFFLSFILSFFLSSGGEEVANLNQIYHKKMRTKKKTDDTKMKVCRLRKQTLDICMKYVFNEHKHLI